VSDGDWRSRKRDATHQRIYDEAMRLFRERGYEAVSVGDIATAAGVSVPTFYAHYPNAEHIVMPMPTQAEVDQVVGLQPADQPLGDRVQGAIRTWLLAFGPVERAALLERWRVILASPTLRTRTAEFERMTTALVLSALPVPADGAEEMTTRVVVAAMLSAYTQILFRWAETDGEQPLEDVADEVLTALRKGL
jgi:AcrR family transcriptional regulator